MKKTYVFCWLLVASLAAPAFGALFSSTLPSSRSAEVGAFTSFFGTLINAGDQQVTGCGIALESPIGATFFYQTTDPQTNQTVGSPNTPVDISAGGVQTFLLGVTAQTEVSPTDVVFRFACNNSDPAPVVTGVNTLLFSASNEPTPDIVALSATLSNDGIVTIPPGDQFGFFTVAAVNVGVGSTVDVFPRATGTRPETLLVCETNPASGACLGGPAGSVTTTIGAGATPTFAVFVAGDTPIAFDPANNRIFLDFVADVVRGSTSVALRKSTDPFISENSLHQAAFVVGTSTYRFGHNSIPNIEIIGAPTDTDFERCAMLHDGFSYLQMPTTVAGQCCTTVRTTGCMSSDPILRLFFINSHLMRPLPGMSTASVQ